MGEVNLNTGEITKSPPDRSEEISELAKALSAAQSKMESAPKDTKNLYYSSVYASLDSVWKTIRDPLTSNELSVIQQIIPDTEKVIVKTILLHTSGQWISSTIIMTPGKRVKDGPFTPSQDPQSWGSCISYARRYALMAMVCLPAEDDDGNAAAGSDKKNDQKRPEAKNPPPPKSPTKPAAPHWIENEATRKSFWKTVYDSGLDENTAHAALNVKSLSEFKGTKNEAYAILKQWKIDHPNPANPDGGNGSQSTPSPAAAAPPPQPPQKAPPADPINMDEPIGADQGKLLRNTLVGWLRADGGIKVKEVHDAVALRYVQIATGNDGYADVSRRDLQLLLDASKTRLNLLRDALEFIQNLPDMKVPSELAKYIAENETPAPATAPAGTLL